MKITYLTLFVSALFLFTSCNNDSQKEENNETETQIETNADEPETEEPKEEIPATTIEFDKYEHDFGTFKEGELVKHTFKFKNTGDNPLVIQSATGSCGCTVPKFTDEPIAPGEEGEIKVEFNSKGRVGVNEKTVTVIANTDPKVNTLKITSEVLADENSVGSEQ